MRLGYNLCQEELEFLQKRKVVVAEALKQVLQLEEDLQMDEVGKQRPDTWLSACSELSLSFQHPALPAAPSPSLPKAASHCLSWLLLVLRFQVRAVLGVIQLCVHKGTHTSTQKALGHSFFNSPFP